MYLSINGYNQDFIDLWEIYINKEHLNIDIYSPQFLKLCYFIKHNVEIYDAEKYKHLSYFQRNYRYHYYCINVLLMRYLTKYMKEELKNERIRKTGR